MSRRLPLKLRTVACARRGGAGAGLQAIAASGGNPQCRLRRYGAGVASASAAAAHIRPRAAGDRGGCRAARNTSRRHATQIRVDDLCSKPARCAAWAAQADMGLSLRRTGGRGQLGLPSIVPSLRTRGTAQRAGRGEGGRRALIARHLDWWPTRTRRPQPVVGVGERTTARPPRGTCIPWRGGAAAPAGRGHAAAARGR